MCAGVSKSGSPISRWMTSRPARSIARALASTENAVSVPSRATPAASSPVCASVAPIGAILSDARELRRRHLAHDELLHLAGDRHGELVHELPVAGDLEGRDLPPAGGRQLLGADRAALAQLDPGHDLLAVARAGHADEVGVADGRDADQELLDLARVDVLSAADEHVLDAPDDLHVALVVHRREVARVHPAVVVDRLARGALVVPVAQHHAVAAGALLAGHAARDRL